MRVGIFYLAYTAAPDRVEVAPGVWVRVEVLKDERWRWGAAGAEYTSEGEALEQALDLASPRVDEDVMNAHHLPD